MLRRYRGFLAAIAGLVLLGEAPSTQRVASPSPPPKEQAEHPTGRGQSSPSPLPVSIVETPEQSVASERRESASSDHDTRDLDAQIRAANAAEKQILPAWIASVLSGFGTLLIVWTLLETRRSNAIAKRDYARARTEAKNALNAAKEATGIAERTAKFQSRPYLFPSHAGFKINDAGEPIAEVVIKNFGQTPAINKRGWTHSWVECYPLHDALPEAPDDLPMGSAVIGPGATSEAMQPHGGPLNEYSRAEIEAGRAALYVYGFGSYMDIFGNEHFYRFIYFASGEGALDRGRLSPYSSGNVIDFN